MSHFMTTRAVRWSMALGLAGGLSGALAACGSDDEASPNPIGPLTTPTTQSAPADEPK